MKKLGSMGLAEALIKEGWSNIAIASKLGVSSRMISKWRGEISDKRASAVIKYNHSKRSGFFSLDSVRIRAITSGQARIYAALLYWCEGSKYPVESRVCFTSSDIEMQKLFISLLRRGFKIDETKFRIWLQLHTDHNRKQIFSLWSQSLGIPLTQFLKPTITKKTGNRFRKVYHGTCTLRYHDYSVLLRLIGIYKRFTNQVNSLLF